MRFRSNYTRHGLVVGFLLLLVAAGCRKDARAQETAAPDVPPAPAGGRGLSWILDKYRNDNLHVLVAAHRGNWDAEPENSLAAIQQGIANGVEILELDVRLTADEQLVLMHDKTLGRTATGSGEIKYLPLSYLKEQRLIGRDGKLTDQRIPTLEEALLAAKGKVLIMLDKSEYLLPWIEKVLQKTGTAQQVVLLEFNPYKQTVATYGDLLRDVLYVPGVHQSNSDIDGYIRSFEESPYNPSCFAFWIKKESSAVMPYIERVQQAGDRIWINTVDADQCAGHTDSLSLQQPDAGWGWALAKGANVLLTDRPRELIAYLQSIHRRN